MMELNQFQLIVLSARTILHILPYDAFESTTLSFRFG